MTTRVTEAAALVSRLSLAASPLNARARAFPLLNLKKKRGCSQSSTPQKLKPGAGRLGEYGKQAWGVELRKHSRVHGKQGVWSY